MIIDTFDTTVPEQHPLKKKRILTEVVKYVCLDCITYREVILPASYTLKQGVCGICRIPNAVISTSTLKNDALNHGRLSITREVSPVPPTPLIDFDVLTYRAGYAANDLSLETNLETADRAVEMILETIGTKKYKGFLTGKDNFRYKVATIKPYKGNRDASKRPVFYNEIRDHYISKWGAKVTDKIEADDAIGLLSRGDGSTIICSVDKDFRTIPGLMYNIGSRKIEVISERQAAENFYTQMLVGDKVDNIPGLKNPAKSHFTNPPNFSEDTAKEYLAKAGSTSAALMRLEVELLFINQYGRDRWDKYFDEVATLLFIMRYKGKKYEKCKELNSDERYEIINFGGSTIFDVV